MIDQSIYNEKSNADVGNARNSGAVPDTSVSPNNSNSIHGNEYRKTYYGYLIILLVLLIPTAIVLGVIFAVNNGSDSSSSSNASAAESSFPQTSFIDIGFSYNRSTVGLITTVSNLIYYESEKVSMVNGPDTLDSHNSEAEIEFSFAFEYWANSMVDPFDLFRNAMSDGDVRFHDEGVVYVKRSNGDEKVVTCPAGYKGEECNQCAFEIEKAFPTQVEDTAVKGPAVLDFSDALHKTILNFNAFRSGNYSPRLLAWRDDSCFDCEGDFGEDLSGGHYEAGGSFLKIAQPSCFTMTQLSWNLIRFPKGFENAQETNAVLATLKWDLQYWLNAHSAPKRFAAVFGNMNDDFEYPGPPEMYEMYQSSRNGSVEYITEQYPASEITAECAAAMAAGSIVFKDIDAEFSATLLEHATQLFEWSNESRSPAKNSPLLVIHQYLYRSSSMFDEIIWSALWMYRATDDNSYLAIAKEIYKKEYIYSESWAYGWDEKTAGNHILLAELDTDCEDNYKYHIGAWQTLLAWLPNPNQTVPYTPEGLAFRSPWGSTKYASNFAFIGLAYAKLLRERNEGLEFADKLFNFAQSQIEYVMGSKGQSLITGVGDQYPLRPYFQASHYSFLNFDADVNTPLYQVLDQFKNDPNPNTFIGYGYMVGGPIPLENGTLTDTYVDVRDNFVHSESAIDYSAGFIGAAAAILEFFDTGYAVSNCDLDLGWTHPNAGVRDVPCSFRY